MPLFQRRTERAILAAALALSGATLGGCSDIYFDRRDPISLASGDALAANKAAQMVDPWPAYSVKRNIAYSGEKMQTAVERYRNGRVIPPVNVTTSSVDSQKAQAAANSNVSSTPTSSWSPPPTPTVK